jgi:UDP-N-acetylmuramate--alanine ligase
VIVLPIYAASEEPIPGVTAERLAERIKSENGWSGEGGAEKNGPRVEFAPEFAEAVFAVVAAAHEGDMILTLGAGSVSQLAPQILAALEASE